ncbi:alpha/beta hydrolase [uncultured Kordia sp.]|uniref:alpha/beta hydrolase n=1 Tax=uncultured Kordia sp. TaxID=507699 RepID=UPI00260FDA1A|nr:alpha/beta hydrolase [uncultured Kordia sp.]
MLAKDFPSILLRILLLIVCILQVACAPEVSSLPSQHIEKGLQEFESPISTSLNSVSFHPNIIYGDDKRNRYDFFKPNTEKVSSLLILVHGGGFVNGDKSKYYDSYRYRGFIDRLLEKNIAVATINYRFVDPHNNQGILNSLHDVKRALQHMRYFSDSLHFDKENVMLYGSSAGSAAAMWIAFQDDMAIDAGKNSLESESTRIKGFVGISTQANYDIAQWHQTVFASFQEDGFTATSLEELIQEHRILLYYGIDTRTDLTSETTKKYLEKTNMLQMLSADDPVFYLQTDTSSGGIPENMGEIFHHPLHVKTIQQHAIKVGAKGIYYCPQIDLDTTEGESYEDFIIRTIGN